MQIFLECPYLILTERNKLFWDAKQMFIQNPLMTFNCMEDLKTGLTQFLKSQKQSNDTSQEVMDIFNTHKVPKLAIVIINACWLANRNPEATDKKLFKDYRLNNKKNKRDTEVIHPVLFIVRAFRN